MPVIPNANPPNPILIKDDVLPVAKAKLDTVPKEIKPIIAVSELPNLNETINGSSLKKEEKKEQRKSDSVSCDI